jgi:hypothetical protein
LIAADTNEPNCDSNNSSNRNSVVVENNDADAAPPTNQPVNNSDTPTTAPTTTSDTPKLDNTVNITINNENDINILSQQNNNANPNKSSDKGMFYLLFVHYHFTGKTMQ